MKNVGGVLILKIIYTWIFFIGAKERSEIYEAFEKMYPILESFKKVWVHHGASSNDLDMWLSTAESELISSTRGSRSFTCYLAAMGLCHYANLL